jgi:hypothetical protein
MQRHLVLFASILFFAIGSCRSQITQKAPQPTKDPTVYKGVTDQNCAVEVTFGSRGSGVDGAAMDKVVAAIERKKLKHSARNIGREGETRICLPLSELKGKAKTAFINELKKIAKEGELVSVSIK